jgi:acyl carrier protein
MTRDEITGKLNGIFRDVLDDAAISLTRETTAADVEGWDSLTHISLIVAIEEEFKIRFDLYEVAPLKNVGEIIDLIHSKVS